MLSLSFKPSGDDVCSVFCDVSVSLGYSSDSIVLQGYRNHPIQLLPTGCGRLCGNSDTSTHSFPNNPYHLDKQVLCDEPLSSFLYHKPCTRYHPFPLPRPSKGSFPLSASTSMMIRPILRIHSKQAWNRCLTYTSPNKRHTYRRFWFLQN
jgi:hypothetical protein